MSSSHLDPQAILLASVGEAEEAERVHLEQCSQCRREVDALRAQAAAFAEAHSFERFAAQPRLAKALGPPTKRAQWRRWRWPSLGGAGLALAAAAAAWVLTWGSQDHGTIRFKGPGAQHPTVTAIRLREEEQSQHVGRVGIREGDRLRFKIMLSGPGRLEVRLDFESGSLALMKDEARASGTYVIPPDAVHVTSPVEAGTLRVVVRPAGGEPQRSDLDLYVEKPRTGFVE